MREHAVKPKPGFIRGELHCVGATTLDEYRKHIENPGAGASLPAGAFVGEPSVEDTIAILRGLGEATSSTTGARIQDAALVAAAVLSEPLHLGRFLPDKAIDLVDEAASKLRIEIDSMPTEIDVVERRIRQLEIERVALAKETDAASKGPPAALDEELANLTGRVLDGRTWQSRRRPSAEIRELKEQLEALRAAEREGRPREGVAEIQARPDPRSSSTAWPGGHRPPRRAPGSQKMLKEEVDEEDIAEVVAKWTGVPSQAGWRARWSS